MQDYWWYYTSCSISIKWLVKLLALHWGYFQISSINLNHTGSIKPKNCYGYFFYELVQIKLELVFR